MTVTPKLDAAERRNELQAAEHFRQCVDDLTKNQSAAEVSSATGIPQELITKLVSGDIGALIDAAIWQRKRRKEIE